MDRRGDIAKKTESACLSPREGQQQGGALGSIRTHGEAYLREPLPVHMIHHDDLIVKGARCASWTEGGGEGRGGPVSL